MNPKVFVIILNYHRPDDTIECVNSVLASETKGFSLEIVMVDNSEDNVSYVVVAMTESNSKRVVDPKDLVEGGKAYWIQAGNVFPLTF